MEHICFTRSQWVKGFWEIVSTKKIESPLSIYAMNYELLSEWCMRVNYVFCCEGVVWWILCEMFICIIISYYLSRIKRCTSQAIDSRIFVWFPRYMTCPVWNCCMKLISRKGLMRRCDHQTRPYNTMYVVIAQGCEITGGNILLPCSPIMILQNILALQTVWNNSYCHINSSKCVSELFGWLSLICDVLAHSQTNDKFQPIYYSSPRHYQRQKTKLNRYANVDGINHSCPGALFCRTPKG